MPFALKGPRLTLRPPEPADAPALLELAGDPEVTRWFSWGPYTEEAQALAWIELCGRQREEGVHLDLLIVDRERGPAGVTGLSEFSARDLRCVVGTWLGTAFQGTGVNRESKAIITALAFELLGMRRVGSYSNPENERSTKALLGVGFRHEGILQDWHRHGDRWLDVNVFGMTADEWAAGPLAQVPVELEGELPSAFPRG